MGFMSALGSLASAAVMSGSYAKANMNAKKYRQGVMYDFSIINRAKFIVYGIEPGGSLKVTQILPVQLNPSGLSENTETNMIDYRTIAENDGADAEVANGTISVGSPKGQVTIELPLDVFDEYMAATANDTLPFGSMPSIDDDYSIYKALNTLERNTPIQFIWSSESEIYGLLKTVNLSTTCYSRWGNPLKGKLTVEIERKKFPEQLTTIAKSDKASQTAKMIEVSSLLASEALR